MEIVTAAKMMAVNRTGRLYSSKVISLKFYSITLVTCLCCIFIYEQKVLAPISKGILEKNRRNKEILSHTGHRVGNKTQILKTGHGYPKK